jgi:hypothetical protein
MLAALQESHVEASAGLEALTPIAADLVSVESPTTPVRPAFTIEPRDILGTLHPALTVTARLRARIGALPSWLPIDWFDDGSVQPVMAAPVFTRAMYQALDSYDREWLIPGLSTLPVPDLVTLLESNANFIEAFLVGLSHEMGRELLWRNYPTDQRGTYFRRFWNANTDDLTTDIYRFGEDQFATHLSPSLNGTVVLLVRGELIRRYPHAIVLALRDDNPNNVAGQPPFEHPEFIQPPAPPGEPPAQANIAFHGHLAPDMVLVGFSLKVEDVVPQKWWFVIAEHPSAPRFGLSLARAGDETLDRDSIAWDDLLNLGDARTLGFLRATSTMNVPDPTDPGGGPPNVTVWGTTAAAGAHILLRDPVRAAFYGQQLLGPTGALQ